MGLCSAAESTSAVAAAVHIRVACSGVTTIVKGAMIPSVDIAIATAIVAIDCWLGTKAVAAVAHVGIAEPPTLSRIN